VAIEILSGQACCDWFRLNVARIQASTEPTGVRLWWDTADKKDGMLLFGLVYRGKPISYCPGCGADWDARLREAVTELVARARLADQETEDTGKLRWMIPTHEERQKANRAVPQDGTLLGWLKKECTRLDVVERRLAELEERAG